VDFTPISQKLAPSELIGFLNDTFSIFDQLAQKHGLEKIKTIGDCYMVVSGIPYPRPDHAEAIAEMALEMQAELEQMNGSRSEPVELRIGLSTGPVVAGVIGLQKFIYDLWGDTVNTASRMEMHGLAGKIQVTEAIYRLLQNKYCFEDRGEISVKGKGEMRVYLLTGRKTPERA
jgi:class 3 adenylate cyclase